MNKVGIKTGAWVMTAAGLGIQIIERVFLAADGSKRTANYSEALPGGSSETRETWVHLVNPDGTTYAQIPEQAAGGIRLARKSELPEIRIAHLTDEQLAAMGYV
jgi:hypothetical protein